MDCPSKQAFQECLLGRVPEAESERLLAHAESCPDCGQLVEQLDACSDHVTEALRNPTPLAAEDACEQLVAQASSYLDVPEGHETATDVRRHLLEGTRIRDYEIVRPLGEGGMGAVFLARHSRLNRDVALKVLSLRRAGDVEAQQRFEQEMAIVGKLQHPGIVGALDAGEHDGVQYLVMEVIEGVDLRQLVDASGPLPLAAACEICRQTAEALDYAHRQQLIHRDVKPSNIMLEAEGHIKLMDLGLARFTDQHRSLTSTQQAMGSLDFMAPEQLRAHDVDQRADLYGLGSTLHFLITGEPPEKRRTASLLVARSPRLEAVRERLPPPLFRLLTRMLVADPAKRIKSAAMVAEELEPFCHRSDLPQLVQSLGPLWGGVGTERLAAQPGATTSQVTTPERPRRRTSWKALVAGALVAMAAVVAIFPWMGPSATPTKIVVLNKLGVRGRAQREIPLFQVHQEAIRALAFAQVSGHLVCGSDDGTVSVRDLPHQKKITVLCQFNGPIRQIALTTDQRLFACVDATGAITLCALEAPPEAGYVRGRLPGTLFDARPVEVLFLREEQQLLIRHADGTLRIFEPESRSTLATCEVPGPTRSMRLTDDGQAVVLRLEGGLQQVVTLPQLVPRGAPQRAAEPVATQADGTPITLSARTGTKTCLVDGKLARVVDTRRLEDQHFIYAEHPAPVTALLALPEEPLLLTGDAGGELRLWHAPGDLDSDMLMASDVAVPSMQMSFDLHQRGRWTLQTFETTNPNSVNYAEAAGVVTITTSMELGGRRHVLEYKVDPQQGDVP